MNNISFESYEIFDFQANIKGETNIIISDSAYREWGWHFARFYGIVSDSVEYYLADLRRVSERCVISGETHAALSEYISLFEGVSEKIYTIGSSHRQLCLNYIQAIDDLDKDIYDPGCDPRDFTTDRINYFCRLIADTPGFLFDGLENWINNGFEWFNNQLFNIFGKKLGADQSLKQIRAAILNDMDYEQDDIKRIHRAIINEDKKFAQKFADLYHEYEAVLVIIQKANEIVSNNGKFTCAEIATIREECDKINISVIEEPGRIIITAENAEEFCSNEENKHALDTPNEILNDAREEMGISEAIVYAFSTATDQAYSELFGSYTLPEGIDSSQAYEYMLIKENLMETVAIVANNEVDIEKFLEENPEIEQWYNNLMSSDNQFSRLVRLVAGDNANLFECAEDHIKSIAAVWWNYEKNMEVIHSMSEGLDPNSMTAIAVKELANEYSNYSVTTLVNGIEELVYNTGKKGSKELNKTILKLMGSTGKKINLALYTAEKLSEITGITEIGNDISQFSALQAQNEEFKQAYQRNFDVIASGNYTEQDIKNLNNSFALLKTHQSKQFSCLSRIAGKEGNHPLKRYYDYMETQTKSVEIGNLEATNFLTYEQYCAQYE